MSNWLAQVSFCLAAIAGAAFAQNSGHAGTEEDEIVELEVFIAEETLIEEEVTLSQLSRSVDSVYGDGLSVLKIPRALSIVTPEAMRQFGIEDFSDLEKAGAGTQRVNYFGIPGSPYIRGAKAGTFFNGMLRAYQRNEMPISFGSLESMDIVKGPAPGHLSPTLVGGFVNFVPKAPYFDKFRGSVEVTIGRWDHYRVRADVGGPLMLMGRPSAYRISLTGQLSDSYYDTVRNDFVSFYGAVKMKLNEDLRVFAGTEYFDFKSNENAGWNRPTQSLIDIGRYVIGEPVDITDAAWRGSANRDFASFPAGFGFANGVQDFNAMVVPRAVVDEAMAAGLISDAARAALLDLGNPDDLARAYGQPLPGSGVTDPLFNAAGGRFGDFSSPLAALMSGAQVDGYRYTRSYFDSGGIVFTTPIEASRALADDNDYADSRDWLVFVDLEKSGVSDRLIRNQFLLEWLHTEKLSSYGYAIETEQFVVADKVSFIQDLDSLGTQLTLGGSFRFSYAKMVQDFFAEPFSRRDLTRASISPNSIVATGPQRDPSGNNLWSPARGANIRSQLYQYGAFAVLHTIWNSRLSTFISLRGEIGRYYTGIPANVDQAGDELREALSGDGAKSYFMAAFSPVIAVTEDINLYASVQAGTAIDPTHGGPIFGEGNFSETELYEVGLKGSFGDGKLYGSLAFYYWDQSNFNTRDARAEPLRAQGLELETTFLPSDRISIVGSMTAQRVRHRGESLGFGALFLDEEGWALNGGLINGASDRSFPDSNPDLVYPGFPEVTAKVFAVVTLPNGFGIAGGTIWRDTYYHNFERTLSIPSSLSLNANVFWRAERWEAFLALENVTSGDFFTGAEPTFAANTIITKAPPISWKFSLRYKF